MVGARTEVVVALNWTSFAADGQDTIVLSMVTGHGRATPLLWKTVASSTLRVISRSAVRVRSPAPDYILVLQILTSAIRALLPWRLLA